MEEISMPRVTHFEIMADDPERAVTFYQTVFGWHIHKWNGPIDYWLTTTGPDTEPGINGAIMHRMPGGSVHNTIGVPSVDDYIKKIVAAGGKVIKAKIAVPHVGWFAYCADSEGNVFGILQDDPNVK
jgi:predicted enzyme related to lactoylglutathione lyase